MYKYNRYISTLTTTFEDGVWVAKQEVRQSRRNEPSEKWETKVVTINATSSEMGEAVSQCSYGIMAYLEKAKGDLFAKETNDSDQGNEAE